MSQAPAEQVAALVGPVPGTIHSQACRCVKREKGGGVYAGAGAGSTRNYDGLDSDERENEWDAAINL